MIENIYIKRAGHILMLIHWAESISRMLVLFKNEPELLKRVQDAKSSKEITMKMWNMNKEWLYSKTLEEFSSSFPTHKEAIILLEDYLLRRDVLSHPQMSPDGTFFCVINELSRNNAKKKAIIHRTLGRELAQEDALRVAVTDKDYSEMLDDFMKLDTDYFPKICAELKSPIRYEMLRWPYDERK